jgi:hypothetical protein
MFGGVKDSPGSLGVKASHEIVEAINGSNPFQGTFIGFPTSNFFIF